MKLKMWFVAIALCVGIVGFRVLAAMPIHAACLGNSGLLANGSFETDKTNWRFYTDGTGRFRIDTNGVDCAKTALLQLDQPGNNTQLYQTRVKLEPATRYRLSFAAYSSAGNDLGVYLHKHNGDYTSYGLSVEQVDLTTAWQHFTIEFVSEGFSTRVTDGRLRFWISSHAEVGERYWIDDVVLTQITGDDATATTAPSPAATATATLTPPQPTPTDTPVSITATADAPSATPTAVEPTPTPPVPTPTATKPVGANPQQNPIVWENQQPGTTAWKLGRKANDSAGQIKGYASSTSVNKGERIDFHISVDKPQPYTIDIYRMGWYQGKGGRLMTTIGPLQGSRQSAPVYERDTGLIYCNWDVSYTLQIPDAWTSGIYLAKLTNADNYQNYIIFVVRDDARRADLLYQQTVMTYQAYNNYPHDQRTGKSLYEGPSKGDPTIDGGQRAVMVSFDRPYSRDGSSKFFVWEYYFIRWMEQAGYDVAYATNLDVHRNGDRLLDYNAFVSSGHDEYWSYEMVDAAERARDRGVNLAFFGGNTVYWQVHMEPSPSGVQDRVMVGYKDAAKLDPVADRRLATDKWRNVGRAEQSLLGVMFPQGAIGNNTDYRVSNSDHWIYAGTGLQNGDKIFKIIGYEIDGYDNSYSLPPHAAYTTLAASPFDGRKSKQLTADTTLYAATSGALVFAGATTSWSWGLDKAGYIDPRLQRMTANVLDRLGGTARAAAQLAPLTRPDAPLSASRLTTFDCAAQSAQLTTGTDFETGADAWQLSVAGKVYPALPSVAAAADPDAQDGAGQGEPLRTLEEDGCGHALHLTGPVGQPLQLFQDGLQLDAGQPYRLQVALNGAAAGRVSLYLVDPAQGYRTLGVASATFAVKAGWRNYYVDFTATNFEGALTHARLLLLFHPNLAVDPSNRTAGQQVDYLVDAITLLPIAHYAADDDPLRLYSWRDYDEELEATNGLAAQVTVAAAGELAVGVAGHHLILQDLESGGLLYGEVAETDSAGRVYFADVPLGEYLLLVEPAAGYLTPEPVLVAVAPDRVTEAEVVVTRAVDAIYLPLIRR